jgi:Fe-S-cluster containining protein
VRIENPQGLSDVEYYRVRGFRIVHIDGVAVAARGTVWHRCDCPQHQENRCAIYPTRPKTCQDFPTSPDQIKGTPCTYRFVEEDADGAMERV